MEDVGTNLGILTNEKSQPLEKLLKNPQIAA